MIHHHSLSILLRPEIHRVDADCTAGAERIAINDAVQSRAHGHRVLFCASGEVVHLPPGIRYVRLWYPMHLIDVFNKLSVSSNILLSKIAGRLYSLAVHVFEFIYVLQYIAASRSIDRLYTVQVPLAGALLPDKTIVLCHDASPRTFYFSTLLRSRFVRVSFVCCSNSLRDQIVTGFRYIPRKQVAVLHNAVDTRIFFMKRSASITKKTFVFGYAGTWAPEKGTDILADVIHKVHSDGKSGRIKFRIAGGIDIWDRPEWEKQNLHELKEKIEQLQNMKNVTILGKLSYSEMPAFYRSVDYLLFPSVYNEPFGNVLIESMASGTPPISFDRGAAREIIRTGAGKILLLPANARVLCESIYELAALSPSSYIRMSKLARHAAENSFSTLKRWRQLKQMMLL